MQKIESFCDFLTIFDDFNRGLGGFSRILTNFDVVFAGFIKDETIREQQGIGGRV